MQLEAYQKWSRTTAIYPPQDAVTYLTLGLTSEAGEVAGKVKKKLRDGGINVMDTIDEIGDVFWYLTRLCDELGFEAEDVIQRNMDKLQDRLARNVIGGSGDKR